MADGGRIKVLVSAYACEPHKGSEPGVGWNWAKQIAKFAEAWVITRANNKEAIEEELKRSPEANLHFVYVDLPKWVSFWKKGQRGVHIYYFFWLFAAYLRARKLVKKITFDLAHHITFVNDWLPPFISLLPIRFVWGPIGSNKPVPKEYLIGFRYYLKDRLKHLARAIMRAFNPLLILTLMKSRRILFILKNQLGLFPFNMPSSNKFVIQQANAVDVAELSKEYIKAKTDLFKIFSAGTLIPIKGFHLSVPAVADLSNKKKDISLVIAGGGSLRNYLQSLSRRLNIEDKVEFIGNVRRSRVVRLMQESDIFLFPSFEGGGMVVLEAMASGLPVVCLDYGGPGEMVTEECGIKVKPVNLEQTIRDLAAALLKLANDPELRKRMGEAGRRRVQELYTWDKKGEFIKKVYEEVLNDEGSSRP